MNNNYFITMMFALIMILLVTLFSMIIAYFIATKLKSNIMKTTVEKTLPQTQHLPTAYPTGRPDSIHWQFVDRHLVSHLSQKPTQVINEVTNKRDRRSLESFCWIPTEIQPVQGLQSVQAVQSSAYYNKYGDFNSLHRSKQSIFLV